MCACTCVYVYIIYNNVSYQTGSYVSLKVQWFSCIYTGSYSMFKTVPYFLTHTDSMDQSSSCKANWFLTSQEILHILWNPKVQYHIHKCSPTAPILSQLDPVLTPTSHFLRIYLNIILPSMPGSPKWSLSLRFPHQNTVHTPPPQYVLHAPPISFFCFITRTILGVEYRSLSSSLCSFLHSPLTSSLLGPNILLYTLFSNTCSLCSSLNVNDQVPQPYKTTGKIIVPYILIFKFLDSKLEDKRFCTK